MNIEQQLNDLLPTYDGIANLQARAVEINLALAQELIDPSEHRELLADLVRTQGIVDAANTQEQMIFLEKLINALAAIPIPS
jgi:hypothetical protein